MERIAAFDARCTTELLAAFRFSWFARQSCDPHSSPEPSASMMELSSRSKVRSGCGCGPTGGPQSLFTTSLGWWMVAAMPRSFHSWAARSPRWVWEMGKLALGAGVGFWVAFVFLSREGVRSAGAPNESRERERGNGEAGAGQPGFICPAAGAPCCGFAGG